MLLLYLNKMKKKIEICKCLDCPNLWYGGETLRGLRYLSGSPQAPDSHRVCKLTKKQIKDLEIIDKSCVLEDY